MLVVYMCVVGDLTSGDFTSEGLASVDFDGNEGCGFGCEGCEFGWEFNPAGSDGVVSLCAVAVVSVPAALSLRVSGRVSGGASAGVSALLSVSFAGAAGSSG